jgi:hypothetical protein
MRHDRLARVRSPPALLERLPPLPAVVAVAMADEVAVVGREIAGSPP